MLDTEEDMATIAIQKAIQSSSYYQNSTTRLFYQRTTRPGGRMNNFITTTEQLPMPRTIYASSWIRKLAWLGPSTDLKDTPRRGTMVTKPIIPIRYQSGINTGHNNSRRHATARPDIEGPLTPYALPKRYWTMNSHRASNL